jgi:hypothetical protein
VKTDEKDEGGDDMDLHDEIAEVAYQLWEKEGRVNGRDLEQWRAAEIIVGTRLKEGSEMTMQTREPCESLEAREKQTAQRRRRQAR